MKSKLTALAATLAAVVVFTVPAVAEVIDEIYLEYDYGFESAVIDGVTFSTSGSVQIKDDTVTITNGGVIAFDGTLTFEGSLLSIVITNSSYLVSASEDSTAAVTRSSSYAASLTINGDLEISFDSEYLASLVAGTATEYTYQIFDSALSSVTLSGEVIIDDSWQDVSGVVSVTYDESARTVTVVVPEPGAFGLFAGVAALALTAARRSRKNA